jgi:DNA-binding response OmpR family regulator
MSSNNYSFLLVEDNLDLASAVIDYLELEGIKCDHTANGLSGLALIKANPYDVIILDLNLPKISGLDVCEKLRENGIDTPVLMLTARDTLDDKLVGFSKGADDYLIKPFAMEELIVRTKVLAKRRSGQISQLSVANIILDVKQKQAFRNNQLLSLSPTAYKILEILMRASPDAVSREKIIQRIWGDDQPDSNSLKVHIFNLRKQIDGTSTSKLIHTISGNGFAIKEIQI